MNRSAFSTILGSSSTSLSRLRTFLSSSAWLLALLCVSAPYAAAANGRIVITKGGTYSGTWVSDDPTVAAVLIKTDESVTLENSYITSRGNLIYIIGTQGAHVTIRNVVGTGIDPEVAGRSRGIFVVGSVVESLLVENCNIIGTHSGFRITNSRPSFLKILNNLVRGLEDRASDGHGGLEITRPSLGHFILLNEIVAPLGAEIAWNQVRQTIGASSTEDFVNIYKSQGTQGSPIYVHDNYFEGNSSSTSKVYTGNGMMTDGDSSSTVSAYVLFEANQIVHTAGSGIAIANGHDIVAKANRIVSCGKDAEGNSFSTGTSAIGLVNYYKAPDFFNNSITGTIGGMVTLGTNGKEIVSDFWVDASDVATGNNSVLGNLFTDPCLIRGVLNLEAENAERSYWDAKVKAARQFIGWHS
jgi:hypothetical protein